MRKILLASAMTMGAMMFAQQRPIITKWQTSSEQDKQIAINNRGAGTYTFEKVGNPSEAGSGILNEDRKTTIDLPSSGEYIVKITPTTPTFALYIWNTLESEAAELKELMQWGSHNWGTTVGNMFGNCKNLIITATDVPDFSTVEDMSNMFYKASSITDIPNINQWNTSNVTEMFNMFNQAEKFNANISAWDTSKVTKMNRMFKGAAAFNQDISAWNTSNVQKFYEMFQDATAFDQSVNFDLSKANDVENMFDNAGLSCVNYTKTLKAWAENTTTPRGLKFSAKGVRYGDIGKTYREKLISEKGWTFAPKGELDIYEPECDKSLSTKEINAVDFKIINPVKNTLVIRSSAKINKVEIYATTGQLVKTFAGNQAEVSALAKGIYILKIETDKGNQTAKIVKE